MPHHKCQSIISPSYVTLGAYFYPLHCLSVIAATDDICKKGLEEGRGWLGVADGGVLDEASFIDFQMSSVSSLPGPVNWKM